MASHTLLDLADRRVLVNTASEQLLGVILQLNCQPRYRNGLDVIGLTFLLLERRRNRRDATTRYGAGSSREIPASSGSGG